MSLVAYSGIANPSLHALCVSACLWLCAAQSLAPRYTHRMCLQWESAVLLLWALQSLHPRCIHSNVCSVYVTQDKMRQAAKLRQMSAKQAAAALESKVRLCSCDSLRDMIHGCKYAENMVPAAEHRSCFMTQCSHVDSTQCGTCASEIDGLHLPCSYVYCCTAVHAARHPVVSR